MQRHLAAAKDQTSFLNRTVKTFSVATYLFRGIILNIRKNLRWGTSDSMKLSTWDYVCTVNCTEHCAILYSELQSTLYGRHIIVTTLQRSPSYMQHIAGTNWQHYARPCNWITKYSLNKQKIYNIKKKSNLILRFSYVIMLERFNSPPYLTLLLSLTEHKFY